jgi:hypothetical protein
MSCLFALIIGDTIAYSPFSGQPSVDAAPARSVKNRNYATVGEKVKNALAATILATALIVPPAFAGNLSDPVVTPEPVVAPEVVAEAAAEDSGKTDALIVAIWAAMAAMTAGNAF